MHHGPNEALRGAAFGTPLGTVVALASERGLTAVSFDLDLLAEVDQDAPSPALEAFAGWLRVYFARRFDALPPVPLDLPGGPSREVWDAVCNLPIGRTSTYGQVAAAVGRPQAARAIGAAVARNPIMLVIPCHRVVAANGSLTGYAGGVERKAWLLRHEGVLLL